MSSHVSKGMQASVAQPQNPRPAHVSSPSASPSQGSPSSSCPLPHVLGVPPPVPGTPPAPPGAWPPPAAPPPVPAPPPAPAPEPTSLGAVVFSAHAAVRNAIASTDSPLRMAPPQCVIRGHFGSGGTTALLIGF